MLNRTQLDEVFSTEILWVLSWLRVCFPITLDYLLLLLVVSSQQSSQECSDHHNKHAYIPVDGLVLGGFKGLLHGLR